MGLSDPSPAGPSTRNLGVRRLVRLLTDLARSPPTPDELAALLLPIVGRAVRSGRGPATVLHWVRLASARHGTDPPRRLARVLTEELVRLLLRPPPPPGDTLAGA